jgi:hypothetical protein
MKKYPLLVLFISSLSAALAQDTNWTAQLSASGIYTSNDVNPFWFTTNTNAQFGDQTSFSLLGEVTGSYPFTEKASLIAGAAFYYRNEVPDEFQRRDLYLQYKNPWLKVTLGAKKDTIRAQGLSATNKDILRSGNSRPLGGLLLEAPSPLKLSKIFSVDWAIAHYQLNDDRYVDDVRLHYKRLGLVTKLNPNNKITAQISHYAQWAGNSPDLGKLPSDFKAFTNVFFAKGASDIPTEADNALGSHLGSYLLDYERETAIGTFSIYHEHPFEDGSGSGWANIPDGIWGIHFQAKERLFLSGVLYEYVHTKNQSYNSYSGADNYFNNGVYRSGWSYEKQLIGMPFFIYDPSLVIDMGTQPIISNRIQLHHVGLTGWWHSLEWTIKTSYVMHSGTYNRPFTPRKELWYNYLSVAYSTPEYGKIKVMLGLDAEKQSTTQGGTGLTYHYFF